MDWFSDWLLNRVSPKAIRNLMRNIELRKWDGLHEN